MKATNIHGVVKKFQGNGRKLGYPTANLKYKTDLPDGVYFGFADLAEYVKQPALIFIGTPTTMGDNERRVEAYLLDIQDKDYYELELKLSIVEFHRGNKTFPDVETLVSVMSEDEKAARQWFKIA